MRSKRPVPLFTVHLFITALVTGPVLLGASMTVLPIEPAAAQVASSDGQSTEQLIKRLEQREQQLLGEGAAAGNTAVRELEGKLKSTLESNRVLQAQQERFINEILTLKRRIKVLEAHAKRSPDTALADQQQYIQERIEERMTELKEEIRRERGRADKLQKDLDGQLQGDADQRNYKRMIQDLQTELSAERKRLQKREQELNALGGELEAANARLAKMEELRNTYVKTRNAAEQLELEMQAKKGTESDNVFLRSEVKRLKEELAKVAASRGTAAAAEEARKNELEGLKRKIIALAREKEELQNRLLAQEAKLGQTAGALEQAAALRSELDEKNKTLASMKSYGDDVQKLHREVATLEKELRTAREALDSSKQEVAVLKSSLETTRNENAQRIKAAEDAKKALEERSNELLEVKRHLSKTIEDTRTCHLSIEEKEKLLTELPELKKELASVRQSLTAKEQESVGCLEQLEVSQKLVARLPKMEKALIVAKNELMLREAELQLFGDPEGEQKAAAGGARNTRSARAPRRDPRLQRAYSALSEAVNEEPEAAPQALAQVAAAPVPFSDMMVLEVEAQKVNLRSGAGEEHSPLMQVRRGTRLTVEAREGDWYRVFTPTGARAYVSKDVVRVIDNGNAAALAAIQGVAAPERRPPQPAVRSVPDQGSLVPFGSVKVAGNPARDAETAALERLRQGLIRPERAAPPQGAVIPAPVPVAASR